MNDGISLLKQYKKELAYNDEVIQAYNVGITAYKKGVRNSRHLYKFKKAKAELEAASI